MPLLLPLALASCRFLSCCSRIHDKELKRDFEDVRRETNPLKLEKIEETWKHFKVLIRDLQRKVKASKERLGAEKGIGEKEQVADEEGEVGSGARVVQLSSCSYFSMRQNNFIDYNCCRTNWKKIAWQPGLLKTWFPG